MNVKFIWDVTFSVGDEVLDSQHKKMFDLVNSIPEQLETKEIKRLIMVLFKHTREHFEHEETMMQAMGYPNLDDHRELHNDLITQLNDISGKPFEDDQAVGDFKKFLCEWVLDHIMNHDKDYFRFAREQQWEM